MALGKPAKRKSISQLRRELAQAKAALNERDNKAGRMEDAEAYMPLPPHLWQLLNEQGFKTGSEVYAPGIKSADEDWCINCSPNVFKDYASGTQDQNYFETDGFASLYAHDGHGKAINILCFSDYQLFESWHKTTQFMQKLMASEAKEFNFNSEHSSDKWGNDLRPILEKKWCRVRLFSALRDILWPVRARTQDMPKDEALRTHKCKRCGRKAEFFSSWPAKKAYLDSGVCERCTEENVQESVQTF